ncbi:MAG: GntR family transcriptional regulator [Bacteroidales bacterium]|jgi:DNA-binding transcriptional regulator YhcF (GntR family)|nr:GntR family transcriptional regulator [Bacteroidales bacterium]
MEFNSNIPISLQIKEYLLEKIILEEWKEEERIPSIREMGGTLGVNPNTIMKIYDMIQRDGIIYNKRGIGYFVSNGAKETIMKERRKTFLEKEMPAIARKMILLDISPEVVNRIYENEKGSLNKQDLNT